MPLTRPKSSGRVQVSSIPKPPSPRASPEELHAHLVKLNSAVKRLQLALQDVQGNSAVSVAPISVTEPAADPPTGAATSITGSNAEGSSPNFARADHDHAIDLSSDPDFNGQKIIAYGGCNDSNAALLKWEYNIADGVDVVAASLVWDVVEDESTIDDFASALDIRHTDSMSSEIVIAKVLPAYSPGFTSASGPALLMRRKNGSGEQVFVGWYQDGTGTTFSGLTQGSGGSTLEFYVNSSKAFSAQSGVMQIGNGTFARLDTTGSTDLDITVRGANGANGVLCWIRPRSGRTPASGQRVLAVQESAAAKGDTDIFSVYSAGGAGVEEDMLISVDNSGATQGNSGLKYNSTDSVMEVQVDGTIFCDIHGNYMELDNELASGADPSAPAANKARMYIRDDGAGKTQLCVRFSSGAVQVLATQP